MKVFPETSRGWNTSMNFSRGAVTWRGAQYSKLITQSFKLNCFWHPVLRQSGKKRKSERFEIVVSEAIDESSGWMSGVRTDSMKLTTPVRKRRQLVGSKKKKKPKTSEKRQGLKRWEVSYSDSSAAIIMQWLWVFNGVISATSSCQREISPVWLNLWTYLNLLEPVLTTLIDVCTYSNIALYSHSEKLCSHRKWIGEIWFQGNLNYCTLGAIHMIICIALRILMRRKRWASAPLAHILLCCRNPSQFRRTLFITLKKKYPSCAITRVYIWQVQGGGGLPMGCAPAERNSLKR